MGNNRLTIIDNSERLRILIRTQLLPNRDRRDHQAVVSQTLFSRIDRPGMVPAIEIMLCTPAVRNIIREARTFEIPNVIETNRQLGMISLDNAIAELFFNGMISRGDAIAQSAHPEKLERMIAA